MLKQQDFFKHAKTTKHMKNKIQSEKESTRKAYPTFNATFNTTLKYRYDISKTFDAIVNTAVVAQRYIENIR